MTKHFDLIRKCVSGDTAYYEEIDEDVDVC